MSELTFKAKCTLGKIEFYAQEYVSNKLQQVDGQDVYVNIKKYRPKRSIKQNNWYYGVAIPMIQHFLMDTQGEKYTKDEVNQYHLNTVIKPSLETKAIFGKVCVIYDIKRTSDMTTIEFMEFKDDIQIYWANYDLIIPDPDQTEFT
tara:strand:+ start:354 stop:791 length:438 start_codon:yes stop_codon:yes gene_type:complete